MKILITGSEGFIGKHLVKFFREKGFEVITFDIVNGQDLLNEGQLTKVFRKKIDFIVHLAAYGDVYRATDDPAGAMIAGAAATANLIKLANKYSIKKIIYASTWEVYGKPKYLPIDEDHPCLPFHPYSIAKYSGELIVRSVMNEIPWLILRLGTVYGPNMRNYAVIPSFISKALNNETAIVYDKGNQSRQFVYIDDICEAFFMAIKINLSRIIINIVGDEKVSVKDIISIINSYLPLNSKKGAKRIGEPITCTISNLKAKRILNWKAKVDIHVGIKNLISTLER